MDITTLQQGYTSGQLTPGSVMDGIYDRIEKAGKNPVWISLVPRSRVLERIQEIEAKGAAYLPLFGVPFAVKDNFDVEGMETTAGCPAFAYLSAHTATVVTRLEAAGAILIGKTNMDQFATGLVGNRSPYGACSSVFNSDFISGGSSSGSAVAVASGLVSFALGTDTAGSGRIPAMFNNIIGLKPTRGVLSAHGLVPACRTLDCVSVFANTCSDASLVLNAVRGHDPQDSYSRTPWVGAGAAPWAASSNFRFGIPTTEMLEFYGDQHNPVLFRQAVSKLQELGGQAVEFDLGPFLAAGQLLYKGPWVAERYAAIAGFLEKHLDQMEPTVAKIISSASSYSAVDTFNAAYQLQALKAQTGPVWDAIDLMLLPTAPRTYTIAEISLSPIERNSHLGYYTNFVNLLDLSAVAVPAGMRPDGLPFGVSLIGQAFGEPALLVLGDRLHRALAVTMGGSEQKLASTPPLLAAATPHGCLLMAVVGAHLSGQPLNWQLTQRKGRLVRTCRTSSEYRFYALRGTVPAKPGLVRVPGFGGPGIEVEIWALPEETVGSFVDGVPAPLAIGTLQIEDGTSVMGFLVEPSAVEDATEITEHGGWRRYLQLPVLSQI